MRLKQTSHLLSHIHFELLQEQLPSISTHTISNTFPFDFCVHSPTCAENKEGGPFLPHSPLPNYCRSVPGEVSPGFPSVKLKMLTTSAKWYAKDFLLLLSLYVKVERHVRFLQRGHSYCTAELCRCFMKCVLFKPGYTTLTLLEKIEGLVVSF